MMKSSSRNVAVIIAVTMTAVAVVAFGQSPPAPSPSKRAVDERRAIYTLIGSNFRPVGETLQGRATYEAAELRKRAARVAFLAGLAGEAYPDVSNAGPPATRAKADIWTRRAEFDALLADFANHTRALAQVTAKESAGSDEFTAAAGAVAQDCKSCHDKFREK